MTTNPTKSMLRRYEEAHHILAAVQASDTIQARLRRVGYDAARFEEGAALLAGVTLAMEQAQEAQEAQRAATQALRQARAQLEQAHRDAVQIARIAWGEEHPWLVRAGVRPRRVRGTGPAPRDASLAALTARARLFFRTAHQADPSLQTPLRELGLGPSALTMGLALVTSVERAATLQAQRAEAAATALTVRGNAFETLDDWMRAFTTVARVALRDRPALLADLGLTPRGRPTKRQE